jgi:hypothetical protein
MLASSLILAAAFMALGGIWVALEGQSVMVQLSHLELPVSGESARKSA